MHPAAMPFWQEGTASQQVYYDPQQIYTAVPGERPKHYFLFAADPVQASLVLHLSLASLSGLGRHSAECK